MVNALGSANDTGHTCTKPEGKGEWVIKISWHDAEQYDIKKLNTKSLWAREEREGNRINLTFVSLVDRHAS